MPIYEFVCSSCGKITEKLVLSGSEEVACPHCGDANMKKLLSTSSTASGAKSGAGRLPGAGDTPCCGSSPSSQGCIPGSCCGKAH